MSSGQEGEAYPVAARAQAALSSEPSITGIVGRDIDGTPIGVAHRVPQSEFSDQRDQKQRLGGDRGKRIACAQRSLIRPTQSVTTSSRVSQSNHIKRSGAARSRSDIVSGCTAARRRAIACAERDQPNTALSPRLANQRSTELPSTPVAPSAGITTHVSGQAHS